MDIKKIFNRLFYFSMSLALLILSPAFASAERCTGFDFRGQKIDYDMSRAKPMCAKQTDKEVGEQKKFISHCEKVGGKITDCFCENHVCSVKILVQDEQE